MFEQCVKCDKFNGIIPQAGLIIKKGRPTVWKCQWHGTMYGHFNCPDSTADESDTIIRKAIERAEAECVTS